MASLNRILPAVYLFLLSMVVFSLSVPPADLLLCAAMLALASLGLAITFRRKTYLAPDLDQRSCGGYDLRNIGDRCWPADRKPSAPKPFPKPQPISTVRQIT